jgi:hypothetical protein
VMPVIICARDGNSAASECSWKFTFRLKPHTLCLFFRARSVFALLISLRSRLMLGIVMTFRFTSQVFLRSFKLAGERIFSFPLISMLRSKRLISSLFRSTPQLRPQVLELDVPPTSRTANSVPVRLPKLPPPTRLSWRRVLSLLEPPKPLLVSCSPTTRA